MYREEDIVRIAKRENNKLRSYLVVNRLQGKHIPVKPSEALNLFHELAEQFKKEYDGEKLLLVGFAETATAIGAAIAVELGSYYIQTTREVIEGVNYIFFSEEHSHATEQKLVEEDMDEVLKEADRIIFVEDEVTTGKTIRNIITILEKKYGNGLKFSVASILNGMDENALKLYEEMGVSLHYLVKTNHESYGDIAMGYAGDGTYIPCDTTGTGKVTEAKLTGWMNARRLVKGVAYQEACHNLWLQAEKLLGEGLQGKILVLGTEEFMYPALYVAKALESKGMNVRFHATTRSPIAVSREADYPLQVRYELRSMYDEERVTFVYDIDSYDLVIVITDANTQEVRGKNSLIHAISAQNKNMMLLRWV